LKTNRDSSQPTNQGINNNFKEVTAVTIPSRDSSESSDQGFQGINSSSEDVTKTNRSIRSSSQENIDNVMKAISNLSIKVENFGKRQSSLEQLVAEDNEVLKSLAAMRTASNIHQLAVASKYLEFFYNEESNTGLLRFNP
jgi:mevalonate kinase